MTGRSFFIRLVLTATLLVACGDDDRPAMDAGRGDAARVDADVPSECPTGTVVCGSACVDTGSDRGNCGDCGMACAAGEVCTDGTCGVLCPAAQAECDGACVDVMTDRNHCGVCGTACASGEICEGGSCVLSCPVGQVVCGAACVSTESDAAHCGECDAACAEGQVCSEGSCATTCATGLMECGSACVDADINPDHCGACDAACPTAVGARALCTSGMCRLVCDPLQEDCNADLDDPSGDGCETSVSTDPVSCGACGRTCDLPNAVPGCVAGACVVTMCASGFENCDAVAANGCESDVVRDEMNCGACGTVCGAGETCADGRCEMTAGDTCGDAIALSTGPNTIAWDAFTTDYVSARPSCLSTTYDVVGPDVVLSYTASADEEVSLSFANATRWVTTVSPAPCGGTARLACANDSSDMTTSFFLPAGETAYVYVADTDDDTDPLADPFSVDVSSVTSPCMPGTGGRVGAAATRLPTTISFVSAYYVALDDDPAGYLYVGGTSDLYRVPKAGGALEDVAAAAGLDFEHLGYEMFIEGDNIYTVEYDTTPGTSGLVFRISSDGGATWAIEDYASFPTAPLDDIRSSTVYSGRVYLVTHGAEAGTTEIWSVDAAATTLPAPATLELTFTGEGDCSGIARDNNYYYLACEDNDRVVRLPVAGGSLETLTGLVALSATNNELRGDDTDGDGVFDVLYLHTDEQSAVYICDPAGPTQGQQLVRYDTGSSSAYGMELDATNNVLWFYDEGTEEFVSVR